MPEIQAGGGCLLLRMAQHRTAPGLDILAANNQPRMPHILWPPASAMEASSSRARSSFSCFAYSLSFSSSLPASCCRFHTSSRFWMRPGCHVFYSTRGGAGAAVSGRCGVNAVACRRPQSAQDAHTLFRKARGPDFLPILAPDGARCSALGPPNRCKEPPAGLKCGWARKARHSHAWGMYLRQYDIKPQTALQASFRRTLGAPHPSSTTEARTQDWKRL